MLARLEPKHLLQPLRHFEADRIGLVGLGNDLRDPSLIEMLGHYQARVGIGARQELHHRQQMAEMLAVMATPPAEDRPLVGRRLAPSLPPAPAERGAIFSLEFARIGGDAALDQLGQHLVDLEQLGNEAPAPVETVGHAPSALLGPVAEPDRPVGGQFAVIGDFLDALGGDRRDPLVGRLFQPLIEHVLPGREQQLPGDGLGEIAIWLLDQQAIFPIEHVAVEGELVGVAGKAEEIGSLPDQVERQVGEAEVDLERRGMPAPFAEPLAKDQRVVAEPLAIVDERRVMLAGCRRVERAMIPGTLRLFLDVLFDRGKAGIRRGPCTRDRAPCRPAARPGRAAGNAP